VIFSYEVVVKPIIPVFADWIPYPVVLVELDEQRSVRWTNGFGDETVSVRLVTNLVRRDDPSRPEGEDELAIGKRVEVCFVDLDNDFALPQFRLADEPPAYGPWQAPSRQQHMQQGDIMSDAPIVEHVEGRFEAAPERVWAFRLDSTNLPDVNDDVKKAERVAGGDELGAGARFRCESSFVGGSLLSVIDVVAAVAGESFTIDMESWSIEDGSAPDPQPGTGMRAREVVTVSATPAGGSAVDVELTLWPPDGIDEASRASLGDAGVAMIEKEFEGMRRALGG
jgi:hypothetical protein